MFEIGANVQIDIADFRGPFCPSNFCDTEGRPPLTSRKELDDANSERSSCCDFCANAR